MFCQKNKIHQLNIKCCKYSFLYVPSQQKNIMLAQIAVDKHNFSKIGKYISNKLHHFKKIRISKTKSHPRIVRTPSLHQQKQSKPDAEKTITNRQPKSKYTWTEPTVGSYRVDYAAIDKNVHQYNFNRSTPHFYGPRRKINETVSFAKDYPDGFLRKQKGFNELSRMAGRDQIKGSIRKNQQNPHECRFEIHQFPTLKTRAGGVQFQKMSARSQGLDNQKEALPEYDCNFQATMKRLNSHIIPFEKQSNRQNLFKQPINFEDYRNQSDRAPFLDKTVAWSKQLPREVQGTLPSYMDKSVNSRMAISLINLKTLQMNCSNIKDGGRKMQRKKVGCNNERIVIYNEKQL